MKEKKVTKKSAQKPTKKSIKKPAEPQMVTIAKETLGEALNAIKPLGHNAVVIPTREGAAFVIPDERVQPLPHANGTAFFLGYEELQGLILKMTTTTLTAMAREIGLDLEQDIPEVNTITRSGCAH